MKDCLFCKIIKGEIPKDFIYQDDKIVVFKDIHSQAPVHVLVVPRKHIESLAAVREEDKGLLGKVQLVIGRLANELKIGNGFRVIINNGKKAGQEIDHLHYHLLGGWVGKESGKRVK